MSSEPAVELPNYTFLPWSRRGIAARIDQLDNLGRTPTAGPTDRASLTATITVDAEPVAGASPVAPQAIHQTVAMVGPGDVKNFKPDVVLRAVPVPGSVTATPGELAYVEFYDEDFPWRYTPARAGTDHRLRPWVALLVLADGEYTMTARPGEVSILVVADDAPLPPVTETWAWAHIQAQGDLGPGDAGTALDQRVTAAPDLALSRLMSGRKLLPNTGYHAFVVPVFELGRLAGLGTPVTPGTIPAQQPAWDSGQPRQFPVLYDWGFATGDLADFEVLARRPKAYQIEAADFGTRPLDISDPGAGVDLSPGTTVAFEGALQPIGFDDPPTSAHPADRTPFPQSPGPELVDQLAAVIDLSAERQDPSGTGAPPDEDPVVTPPAYAATHLGLTRVSDATTPGTRWLAELNLDPRDRAAAGLGVEIVRQHDEEYMERAWAQVEQVEAVNQRIREAELALAAGERVFAKHLAGSGTDRLLGMTAIAQPALRAATTDSVSVRGEVDASRVPAAAQAPAFRRLTRPGRPLMRNLLGSNPASSGPTITTPQPAADPTAGFATGLLDRLNLAPGAAVSTAPPALEPVIGVSQTLVSTAVAAVAHQLPRGRDLLVVIAGEEIEARRAANTLATATLAMVTTAMAARLDTQYPPPGNADVAVIRAEFTGLLTKLTAIVTGHDPVLLQMDPATFATHYGTSVDGKGFQGVVITPSTTTNPTQVAVTASLQNATDFATALQGFTALAQARPAPPPAAALTAPVVLAGRVVSQLSPRASLPARLATVLSGTPDLTAALADTRRLPPVMAYPTFDDPLFEPLRQLSQDYIIPNIAGLPPESIALLQPNVRFIESMLAGVNTEFARELLWNEYPTDQRGTYFARFFDAADAGVDRPPDIPEIPGWHADLGKNSPQLTGLLVLVVRAALLVKFPDTIVFAQRGRWVDNAGSHLRTLDLAGEVRYPVITGRLDPDIRLYGFELTAEEAAGTRTDAGYFFCFLQRPGQQRFGLDLDDDPTTPAPALTTWNDLNWKHLGPVAGHDAAQILVAANSGLTPTGSGQPGWGLTSAHLAWILCQNPVWLARHATDMLPIDVLN